MALFNELNVTIGAKIKGFENAINQLDRKMRRFSRNMQRLGEDLSVSLTAPIVGIGTASVSAFADVERLQNALAAVMGLENDAAALVDEMERLRKVAEAPGLGFEQVVSASARLQAVGLTADQARESITEFGNAVARSGGGAVEFDGAILALTQIQSKGKISAEEINQLNERIFEIRPALESAFGTANSEELQKLGISSEEFIAKVTQEFSKLERVNGGLANSFENFRDSISQAAATVGKEINRVLNLEQVINQVSEAVQRAARFFVGLDDDVKRNIVRFGLLAAAIGPVLLIMGKMASILQLALLGVKNLAGGIRILASGIAFLLSPAGLVIAAVAALAAGFVYAYNESERFRRIVNGIGNVLKELAQIARESFQAIVRGFGQLKSGDFKGAAKSFSEALVTNNPIGLAFTQGKRLAEAYGEGFEDNSNRIQDGLKSITSVFKSTQAQISGNVASAAAGSTSFGSDFSRQGGGGSDKKVTDLVSKIRAELQGVDSQVAISGSSFDATSEKLNILSKGLQDLFDAGLKPGSAIIQEFKTQIDGLRGGLTEFNGVATLTQQTIAGNLAAAFTGIGFQEPIAQVQSLNQETIGLKSSIEGLVPAIATVANQFSTAIPAADQWTSTIKEMGFEINSVTGEAMPNFKDILANGIEQLGQAFESAISGAESFGQAFLKVGRQVVKSVIQQAVATTILNTLRFSKALGPVGLALAGAAGVAAASLFDSVLAKISAPKLASGGLAFGETLAVVGDNPGARTDPEVIAPLSKLQQYLNGGNNVMRLSGVFEVRGNDLILVLDRAKQEQARIG